jgi:serine phosphatase RsbU (regulator of sigma subunit)
MSHLKYFFFSILFWISFGINAQELGRYFIRNFSPKEYNAHTQNWSAIQDDRGLMYIGNTTGVLEYDGKNWRLIEMPNRTTVRTISKGVDGVIYVGSQGDFGYLKPNQQGNMEFVSLVSKLPEEHRNFKDVWTSHAGKEGVYFMTDYKIFRFNTNGTFSYFTPKTDAFFLSFYVDGKLYAHESKVGLLELVDDKLELVKGGEKLIGVPMYTLFSFQDGKLLAGAGKAGLFYIDAQKPSESAIREWNIPANQILKDNILYCGINQGGKLIFGTLKNGIYVLDEQTGAIISNIQQETGLQNNQVWNVGTDNQGGVWACTNKGLSRIELQTPFTFWTEKEGAGKIFGIAKQKTNLYVATGQGVMMLDKTKNLFQYISEGTRQAWCFYHLTNGQNSTLFAGTQAGVFVVESDKMEAIKGTLGGFDIHQPKKFPNTLMSATIDGVSVIQQKNNKWEFIGKIEGYAEETRSIADDEDGNIWLGSYYRGVYQLVYENDSILKPKIVQYDTTNFLPSMKENYSFNVGEKLVFTTSDGIYEFDKTNKKFVPSTILGESMKGGTGSDVRLFSEDKENKIWYRKGFVMGRASVNSEEKDTVAFMRLPKMEVNAIYPEKNSQNIWIGGSEGLFQYNNLEKFQRMPISPMIRQFVIGTDSIAFYGAFAQGKDSVLSIKTTLTQPKEMKLVLPYKLASQSIQFQFSTTSFDSEDQNQYQFILEGNDKNWSEWSTETKKEYTNLWEGKYIFRIKSKNVYGMISNEATYEFEILPPWYRTVWAYLSYLVMAALLTYTLVKINTIRLEKANKRLEEIVKQRTAEIQEKNATLQLQKEEILTQNEELYQQQEEIIAQRDFIEKQKETLENQHTRIMDSIRYAQTIQKGVLPFPERLQTCLKEYFVFYKPKDIVSGDFYWFEQVGEKKLLAVVDCTGHGVPGAFMSMIGSAILNDIVIKEGETSPKNILEGLSKLVRKVLKQDEEGSNQDGMDAALCKWEISENQQVMLSFAGAKRPLLYLKDGKIVEVKGTPKSIAGFQLKTREFLQEELLLPENTMIYLTTDGYSDQSIQPHQHKIGTLKLKELIESSQEKSMAEQRKILEDFLIENQGENPQRDDITIMGLRL